MKRATSQAIAVRNSSGHSRTPEHPYLRSWLR
ncbi:hypothetical protein T06_15494 [Trichinella sp. T6]|nr:hypothetical protein T06_15494 [Trichinella sp. T6]